MPSTVYLVSGANRGIGLAIAQVLATRPDTIVFAGAREPAAAAELQALAKSHPGALHVVKLTSANEADNRAAVEEIKKIAGRLDVVIANAGIAKWTGEAVTAPLDAMREHFEVNVLGVLVLFQAAYPLLKSSTPAPKFVPISSSAGSITVGPTLPVRNMPYGTSKAALNFVVRKLRAENDGLVCFPLCPGTVATDMSADVRSDPNSPLGKLTWNAPDSVAPQIIARIDEATREADQLVHWNGSEFVQVPW